MVGSRPRAGVYNLPPTTYNLATMKPRRQATILELIQRSAVRSQEQLRRSMRAA